MPIKDEDLMPLIELSEIAITPMLNNIGIINPSPSAYHCLDLYSRNGNLFDDSVADSPQAPSFLDSDPLSFASNVLKEEEGFQHD